MSNIEGAHGVNVRPANPDVEGDHSRAVDSRTLPIVATPAACSFSSPVADAFAFVERTQAAEIEALRRLASAGGWLMRREARR